MIHSSTKNNQLMNQHERLFRHFVKDHGRVKLRRLFHFLEKQHSASAISSQIDVPLDEIKPIYRLFRFSA